MNRPLNENMLAALRDACPLDMRSVVDVAWQYRGRPAIESGSGHISYGELIWRSICTLRVLNESQSSDGPIVLASADRTLSVVAQFCLAMCGRTVICLEPAQPEFRLEKIIAECQPAVLVRSNSDDPIVSQLVRVWSGEHQSPIDASFPKHVDQPRGGSSPDRWMYGIYTSGSTGVAKGAALSAAGVHAVAAWARNELNLTENDRMAFVSGLGFDVQILNLWSIWTVGGTLLVADDAERVDVAALARWLATERTTVTFITTTILEYMLRAGWCGHDGLRTVLTGGDVFRGVPSPAFKARLIDIYGPCEATVLVFWQDILRHDGCGRDAGTVPGMTLRLVDETRNDVSVGSIGEIIVSGPGVGLGYIGKGLAEQGGFVRDPGALRTYVTGDLAKQDGIFLQFAGRKDRQVQINSARVELDEVEAAIRSLHGVGVVRVLAFDHGQLAAFVERSDAHIGPTADQVIRACAERLPSYAIPSAVTFASIPLTANGKIDDEKLRSLGREVGEDVGVQNAGDGIGDDLQAVWGSVLETAGLSWKTNLVEAGGSSLTMTQLFAEVGRVFGVRITARAFMREPTLVNLARLIRRAQSEGSERSAESRRA